MMPVWIALGYGFAAALLVYSLRVALVRRFERDVAWLEHTFWRFSPDPKPARPYVVRAYIFAFALLALLIGLTGNPIVSVLVWLPLVILPRLIADIRWKRRKKLVEEQLPEAVRSLSSSVGSGLSLAQAIERMALRAQMPIRTEFYVISNYWKMGADFTTSIEDAKRRLELANFNLFASAIVVNHRMGGNVTATLDRLANSLESIARMRRDVHAATAEGRMSMYFLAAAPVAALLIALVMDAEAVGWLFTRPMGQVVLAICLLITLIGFLWTRSIVQSDV